MNTPAEQTNPTPEAGGNVFKRLVDTRLFQQTIIGLILLSAVFMGLETYPSVVAQYGSWLEWGNRIVLWAFVLEAIFKMASFGPKPWLYFKDRWNCFDFTIVAFSLLPSGGQMVMLARLLRLLRVLRLISAFPELRLIVDTLIRSIPSMGHIALLMSIMFYIYAVAGVHLFHDIDPTHWRSLEIALLSLFRIVTLEDWTDIMYAAMEHYEWAWVYFVSFVVIGTFVMVNLFIAVVLNNLDEAKIRRLEELQEPPSRDEILRELRETQTALQRLSTKLQASEREH